MGFVKIEFSLYMLVSILYMVVINLSLVRSDPDSLPSGVVYENEDKSGKSVDYFEDSADFSDVQALIDTKGLAKAATLCANGVFVLYNQDSYQSDSLDELAILAGKDTCVPPGSMKSLLFVQGLINTVSDTLTVFQEDRFTTPHLIINKQHEEFPRPLQQFGKVGSFILMGSTGWTIVTTTGTEICLKAGTEAEFPVCPVPNASSKLKEEERSWVSAKIGCSTDVSSTITLDKCFNHGSGQLETFSSESGGAEEAVEATTLPPSESEDTAVSIFENCDEVEEFVMLLRIRMTHDFDSVYQVQFPFNKAHAWRTEILDNSIEIIIQSYGDQLIQSQLLLFIRELYIYFAEKLVWAEGKGWPSTYPTQRVLLMGHETKRCFTRIQDPSVFGVTLQNSRNVLEDVDTTKLDFKENRIDAFFNTVKGYDTVMEFVWLIINLVGATCHAALEFKTDFWMDYMNVAYDMYLHPMADFWKNPGKVLRYYPTLLGGYNIERQYKGLAVATTLVYNVARLDKLPRPENVEKGTSSANET